MNRENTGWLILFVIAAAVLAGRSFMSDRGMAKAYVEVTERTFVDQGAAGERSWVEIEQGQTVPVGKRVDWTELRSSNYKNFVEQPAGGNVQLSRTWSIGLWVAALFTLFVLSFLIKDNPLYKIAESVFVGISAAYWMVVAFWDTIVPNLMGKLAPGFTRAVFMPGLGSDADFEWPYLIPLVLGVMLLWRLSPKGGWISRWPMAFFIGTFCGLRLIRFLHADFLSQIRNTIIPLWVTDGNGSFQAWDSLRNVFIVLSVLCCLVYFFFSIEHKGAVGHTARVGIWILMITFGAAFGYTVMGRIALLAIRIEFLFDDWLWIIDPRGTREVEAAVSWLMPAMSGLGLA